MERPDCISSSLPTHTHTHQNAKVVIRFEVRSFLSRSYFLSCSHLAIPAKLHGPKGDRINESLLDVTILVTCSCVLLTHACVKGMHSNDKLVPVLL